MKKRFLVFAVAFFACTVYISAQAVKDRNVIPVAVNLNQVLRMTISNGGNIEFTFNSIDDYKNGLSGDAATSTSANPASSEGLYQTDFTVASSTRWQLDFGSEEATFIGTDDATNTLTLDNVGYSIASNGTHVLGTEITSTPTTDGTTIAALAIYPVTLITDNGDAAASAGDGADNDFTITWRCGTAEGTMNATTLIEQDPSPSPDRYVTNVIFELSSL